MTTINTLPSVGQLGPVTAKLYEWLHEPAPKVGDVRTDGEIKRQMLCRCDVRKCGHLRSAIRRVAKDQGYLWKREWNAGYIKCLSTHERMHFVEQRTGRIRRTARFSAVVLAHANIAEMDDNDKLTLAAHCAQQSIIALAAQGNARKALQDTHVRSDAVSMPRLLEAFRASRDTNG